MLYFFKICIKEMLKFQLLFFFPQRILTLQRDQIPFLKTIVIRVVISGFKMVKLKSV